MAVKSLCLNLLLLLCPVVINGFSSIKNGIKGTPNVECHEDAVVLDLETQQAFMGNIFVNGRSKDPLCTRKFPKNTGSIISYTMQLGRCGMQRLRQASPRGMSFSITVVVSFHTTFVTKVDRAYQIRCFYMEPEERVSAHVEVSLLPTTILSDRMSMPKCEYSVRRDSPNGPLVSFANVGDTVYHVWECKGPDMGMMVKKCFVTNGKGEEVVVVGYDGCVPDEFLLEQLTYDSSLMRAHAASQIFKYADSNQLHFTCQIKLCQKALGLCAGIAPPLCHNGSVEFRKKRSIDNLAGSSNETARMVQEFSESDSEIDVASAEITVVDIDKFLQLDNLNTENLDSSNSLSSTLDNRSFSHHSKNFCLSTELIAMLSFSVFTLLCVTSILTVWCYRRRELSQKLKLIAVDLHNPISILS